MEWGGSAGVGILKDYFFPASLRFFEKNKVKKRGRKRKSYSSSSPCFPSQDHARPFATSSAFTSPDTVTQRDGDNPRVSPPAWGCPLHNHNPPHLPQPPVPKHKQAHLSPQHSPFPKPPRGRGVTPSPHIRPGLSPHSPSAQVTLSPSIHPSIHHHPQHIPAAQISHLKFEALFSVQLHSQISPRGAQVTCHPVLLRHLSQQHRLSPTLCPLPPPPPHTSQGHKPNYPGKRWRHRPRSLPAAPGTWTSPLFCICPPATHRPIEGHHGSGQFPPPARTPQNPAALGSAKPRERPASQDGGHSRPPSAGTAAASTSTSTVSPKPASPLPGSRVPIAPWGPGVPCPHRPVGTKGSPLPQGD